MTVQLVENEILPYLLSDGTPPLDLRHRACAVALVVGRGGVEDGGDDGRGHHGVGAALGGRGVVEGQALAGAGAGGEQQPGNSMVKMSLKLL